MTKEVRKVELGGVTVMLHNKAKVDVAFLDDIFFKSGLDDRELLLILDTEDGFGCKEKKLRGLTFSSTILTDPKVSPYGYDPGTNKTRISLKQQYWGYMRGIGLGQIGESDAVIYIPKMSTEKWKDFKPHFAFVLGHELEHVKVMREDIEFHMCVTWLFDYNCKIFKEVGLDCSAKKKWNFPLEKHCHKKGRKLAVNLFGKSRFNECLSSLKKQETKPSYRETLDFLLGLEGEPYEGDTCRSILKEIRGYYKNKKLWRAAHTLWKEDLSNGGEIATKFKLDKFLPLT